MTQTKDSIAAYLNSAIIDFVGNKSDTRQRRTQGQSQTYEGELRISNCNEINALKILT
jgi:hypothetical protein